MWPLLCSAVEKLPGNRRDAVWIAQPAGENHPRAAGREAINHANEEVGVEKIARSCKARLAGPFQPEAKTVCVLSVANLYVAEKHRDLISGERCLRRRCAEGEIASCRQPYVESLSRTMRGPALRGGAAML